MLIKWSEKFSTGNELIDVQHKALIGIVNNFSIAITDEKGIEALEKVLNDMSSYAWLHFRTEEDLMAKYSFEYQEDHKQRHDQFKKQLLQFIKDFNQSKDLKLVERLHHYLYRWLIDHIQKEDMKYKYLLK
ncbi:MAG: hemerythrin family protein [Clostridia bacterium]|nr:hemerythrin family protein [Clostridia bacterium]